ncbi:probable anion transporter 4, chloroplastic [Trifolium pratense]|uniref:probable anion transporter 4, chloroplastic n=1 Tax=Trifolium pratense TaxID=57577 RepID=UPI001E693AA5|nr:probable anion transporter 4, chloroplastic [Trifolium pratense]
MLITSKYEETWALKVYRVDIRQAAWFSAVPWVVMAIMNYLAGFWLDMMIQSGTSVTLTHKIMQSIGFVGPGLSLIGLATAQNPSVASAWLTLTFGLKSFGHSRFLVNFQEDRTTVFWCYTWYDFYCILKTS